VLTFPKGHSITQAVGDSAVIVSRDQESELMSSLKTPCKKPCCVLYQTYLDNNGFLSSFLTLLLLKILQDQTFVVIRPVTRATRGAQKFSPPMERSVGHTLKLLDIV